MTKVAHRLSAIHADITTLAVDAIVNAANAELFPGGGVDGAIRKAAGREMDDELFRIGWCEPGTALITPGYRLPAKWAIHTVAPIYAAGTGQETVFTRCYESALAIADERGIATIAFPCIGTGIYGWPGDLAAKLAFDTVIAHLKSGAKQTMVTFCCFNDADRARYAALIAGLA
jgi:O-acetyl-ADP-ribose deacetylase (regulator of RNase III)